MSRVFQIQPQLQDHVSFLPGLQPQKGAADARTGWHRILFVAKFGVNFGRRDTHSRFRRYQLTYARSRTTRLKLAFPEALNVELICPKLFPVGVVLPSWKNG